MKPYIFIAIILISCKKSDDSNTNTHKKPKAGFTFTVKNQGALPDTVNFSSTSTDATSLTWNFDNGNTSTNAGPQAIYTTGGVYNVKLVAANQFGSDSITKQVNIILNKPLANFIFAITNLEILPATITVTNTTTGSNVSYSWSFGNGNSFTQQNPTNNFTSGGIYNIKLVATNASGSDSMFKQVKISPYPQTYITFNNLSTNLFGWKGNKIMLLSRNNNLNRGTMFKWVHAMDSAYNFYQNCTGRQPIFYAPNYYIDERATIADVASTCGAACGFLGWTGIEIQNTYFDIVYNRINNSNQFEHFPFYEFGRNFWFYGDKLAYKANDPVTTGYAVFMGFMAMRAAGVTGNSSAIQENIIDIYLANPAYNWSNTLALGQSIPGSGTSGPDLFSSFCFRLRRDYGGEAFVQNLWKNAGLRPNAATTQEAVDNFFIASCQSANKNLTTVFQSWRWPLSANAISIASQYP